MSSPVESSRLASEHELVPLLTYDEVADTLGTSRRHVERLVTAGHLRPIKLGVRMVRFDPRDVRALIERGYVSSNA